METIDWQAELENINAPDECEWCSDPADGDDLQLVTDPGFYDAMGEYWEGRTRRLCAACAEA